MRTFAKLALLTCLASSLLGTAFAQTLTVEDFGVFKRTSYEVYGYGRAFSGEENKTVIGDIFTGAGMGALMLVKTSVVILVNIGFDI